MEKEDYYSAAVECVKDYVLPMQRELFEAAGYDMDKLYGNFRNDENYFGSIIKKGKIYEFGYPKCVCQKVAEGKCKSGEHCECSRQSILYILHELMPEKKIDVKLVETVLRGGNKCRFYIYVD